MERNLSSFSKRTWLLRGVVFTQIALVAFFGAAFRGSIDTGQSVTTERSDGPEWVGKAVGLVICIVFYPFPLWGIIAAWWAGLREGRLVAIILLEGLLWFAAMIALLPGVQ